MPSKSLFWRQTAFQVSMAVCIIFVVLTAVGMLIYPGGTEADHSTAGYSFFQNFFSDLGRTEAWSGESNPISMGLFIAALSLAGAMLAMFLVNLALGFVSRTMPQLNILAVGFSIKALIAFAVMAIALPAAAETFVDSVEEVYGWVHELIAKQG